MAKENMDVKKSVLEFAVIAFVLLGVLFGMNIMSFIFGNLGEAQANSLSDYTITVTNESEVDVGYPIQLNASGYTITGASDRGFNGGLIVVSVANYSDGTILTAANYSINSATGFINTTFETYHNVTIDYTFVAKSFQELESEGITNNSLVSLQSYSGQSNTQFSTISISITLLVLLSVFGFFWKFFIDSNTGSERSSGNFT